MNTIRKFLCAGVSGAVLFALSACAPEVGSERWCANMKAKAKADWTANEAVDYTKHCILK